MLSTYQYLKVSGNLLLFYYYWAAYKFLYCIFTTKVAFPTPPVPTPVNLSCAIKGAKEKGEVKSFKLKKKMANQSYEGGGKIRDAKDKGWK